MSNRVSLFNELKSGGYDACLMTTFSFDFAFYEDVLLRRMQASGINHHILLADHRMIIAALQASTPCKVGTQYVLAPMKCSGAFHPKLLLLIGKKKGLLAVGSHNITLSGFGQNLEITNVFRFIKDSDERFLSVFRTAFSAFGKWLASYGEDLPSSVKESLTRTAHLANWLTTIQGSPAESIFELLFTSKDSPSLWQQLKAKRPRQVEKVVGVSAFFDGQLEFVNKLASLTSSTSVIGIQPDTVCAPTELLDYPGIKAVNLNSWKSLSHNNDYVHAKLLYFKSGTPDQPSIFVSGSANFSSPAWLSEAKSKNAEAVIVLQGSSADEVANNLGLMDLDYLDLAQEIVAQPLRTAELDDKPIELSLLEDTGSDYLIVPILKTWPENHTLAYIDGYGRLEHIEAFQKDLCWHVPREACSQGELISIVASGQVVARFIVMNLAQIRSNSAIGKERELQQAKATLNSDNPDLVFLFKVIESFIPSTGRLFSGHAKPNRYPAKEGLKEKGSLLTTLDKLPSRGLSSERPRCSTGDLGLLLDMFVYSINRQDDNTKAYGEDALGRNEEALVGSEDEAAPASHETSSLNPSVSDSRADENAKLCQSKLKVILNRLNSQTDTAKDPQASDLPSLLPLVLAVLVLTYELYMSQPKQRNRNNLWVNDDHIRSLTDYLFLKLFSEKQPIMGEFDSNTGMESVFNSDEWARTLGYSAWVAFQSGLSLSSRLPVSATLEERTELRWRNSCWLFLAQRINADALAQQEAAKLLMQDGKAAENWLTFLIQWGKTIAENNPLPTRTGFSLAESPKGAFKGFRFVVEKDQNFWTLSNMNDKKKPTRFKPSFLRAYGERVPPISKS